MFFFSVYNSRYTSNLVFFFAEIFRSFLAETFCYWNISIICLTVVLKLALKVFISLHFQTFWLKLLNFSKRFGLWPRNNQSATVSVIFYSTNKCYFPDKDQFELSVKSKRSHLCLSTNLSCRWRSSSPSFWSCTGTVTSWRRFRPPCCRSCPCLCMIWSPRRARGTQWWPRFRPWRSRCPRPSEWRLQTGSQWWKRGPHTTT